MIRLLLSLLATILSFCGLFAQSPCAKKIVDSFGAIVSGDTCQKQIAIVFTGDEFADGGDIILDVLKRHNIKGSFFLTGNFYRNKNFRALVKKLVAAGHYLGPHSDKHLLYNDWTKRDSLLVTKSQFDRDLLNNYSAMKRYGLRKADSEYFIPPYEWYNSTVVQWAREQGVKTINFSAGTRSTADYTYPEMGARYTSSESIYASIIALEESKGLNGFILLIHIGVDPRRQDKFYDKLDKLLTDLKDKGYSFARIDTHLK
jgi:endoglucanase